ncbi:PAS domain S-box protein [Janthinobacterium sp. SUN118]|uniref:MHYT domain-containing protein n=1 Tax=Janthinobacterium sp. SUN118 TaxID=3004100 RepID=UPI0025AF5708|nr:MHYT domain-containing protein [Janthinobacterium sp. SUN118]MDN2708091.1 PAS domain S-box protein [Janthinobacterium sp. SUN118]
MIPASVQQLFRLPADPALLHFGLYEPGLVLLSVVIAIFTSWMAFQMTVYSRAQASISRQLHLLCLLAGSLALGCGVWAMHFVGMLAFDLCTSVDYAPGLTLLSIVPSVAASFVALSTISRRAVSAPLLLRSGLLVGLGIGAMHYTGMHAMRVGLSLRYEPLLFALSLLVAVVLATLALWIRFGLRGWSAALGPSQRNLISACVMGSAISGMHYMGMYAARFVGTIPPGNDADANRPMLVVCVTLLTVALTIFVASAVGVLRYRELFRHLNQSENWTRSLLTSTVDGVITIDRAGNIVDFNGAAERILGWRQADILGRHVSVLVSDVRESERHGLLHYLRTGEGEAVHASEEIMYLRKDGAPVAVQRSMASARLADQDLYVLFITDISERRAMLAALRESEQQLRSLVGNLPGIAFRCTTAENQPMLFISDGVEAITGYAPADFLGATPRRTITGLIAVEDRAYVVDVFNRSVASGEPYLLEYRLQHADGRLRWLWERGTVVHDPVAAARWVDGVILDISERRQMEEDLRMAKEKAELAAATRASFVANMSHEIRTPMNSILGFTDVLLDSPLTPEQRRHLDTVRQSGRSLLRLLNEVLDTAKLDKGAVALELRDYSLLALVDELASTYGIHARAKGLRMEVQYDPQLPALLHGDELRMRQVLGNLLDNAIKFTASGAVSLAARRDNGQLHLLVQDSGIGIAAERRDAIFEPFVQADASTTRRYGGTGLGTTISKQLVTLMQGSIWADAALPHGSVFHVMLPLAPARQQALPASERRSVHLPPLRVLAADDVPQNLELLCLLLRKRGHTVETASDGELALQMTQQHDFDVLLLDLQMPRMDGLAATQAIRAAALRDGRARVPVIAMTASVLAAHRKAALAAGMDGFATKPVEWQALSHEIARVLGLDADPADAGAGPAAPAGRRVLHHAGALQRWAGNESAYRGALLRFASEHPRLPPALLAAIEAGSPAPILALSHKLRGVAANLGLEQLAASLATLEQLCATSGPAPAQQRDETVGALLTQWPAALAAIARLAPPAAKAEALHASDLPAVRQAAGTLLQALRRGELDDAAQARLQQAMGAQAARLAPLVHAIDDFDFSLAQSLLHDVLQSFERESP